MASHGMIDATTQASAAAATAAASAAAAKNTNGTIDQTQFLQLFMAQLKNQDPLSPLDANDLTAQLAQFSSLEQLTGINTRLDTLTTATQDQVTNSLLGLLGRDVTFQGDQVAVQGGVADPVHYTLDQQVTAAQAVIVDANGKTVRTVELGTLATGEHDFTFDGRDADGHAVADGTYHVQITGTVAGSSDPLVVPLQLQGLVDGVDFTSNPPTVTVNGRHVSLDQVRAVRPAASGNA
jgi:flagellar basal-body rod modification protein FlgD